MQPGVDEGPADEEHPQLAVVPVAKPPSDSAVQLDQPIHRFSATVVGAVGGEVRQERLTPPLQGPAEAVKAPAGLAPG